MKRFLVVLAVLLLGVNSMASDLNTNGWKEDTAQIATFRSDSLKYSKGFPLTKYEDLRLIVKADDTSQTGYASDSIAFEYGYRTFCLCMNSSGTMDTCYTAVTFVDTFLIADADTSNLSGYAYMTDSLAPAFNQYIQFYAQGITDNITGSYVKLQFQVLRRLYQPSRDR